MDVLTESGWINELPSDWIGGKYAVRQLCQALEKHFPSESLAPWEGKQDPEEYCKIWGGTAKDAAHSINLTEHAVAVLTRGFIDGSVAPSLFDDGKFRQLPYAAFSEPSVVRNALMFGLFDIDPLWPDEWWSWNSKPWVVRKTAFNEWLTSAAPFDMAGLPNKSVCGEAVSVERLEKREPSLRARVSLSEAVTWCAFGIALEGQRFEMALQWDALANGDLSEVQRRTATAVAHVVAAGADGKITFFRRHVDNHHQKGATQAQISPLALDDYAGFVIGRDDLYYGSGLHRTYTDKANSHWHTSDRRDLYADVSVSRAELLSCFDHTFEIAPTKPAGSGEGPILWSDFGDECLPELQRLQQSATQDEWWTWPEAIAWVGSGDASNIATLRYWATKWSCNSDADVTLGAQHYMAGQWCDSLHTVEHDLIRAIERGAIRTIGRTDPESLAAGIAKETWRGGTVIYTSGTAALANAKNKLTVWAYDIFVNRADLLATFAAPASASADKNKNAAPMTIRTGDPGRPPKGYHLYVAEHERRCANGLALQHLADEARYLVTWYSKQYPEADPVNSGTVKNRIRARHRQYSETDATKLSG